MIRLRAMARRQGRKAFVVAAIGLSCLILAWAHSGPGDHGMAPDEMGTVVSACLAVLEGATVLLLGLGVLALARRARPPLFAMPGRPTADLPCSADGPARPRAGPGLLQVFLR